MSRPVDVLAVLLELDNELQSAANYSGEGCYWSVDDDADLLQRSADARAAVAELIEVAAAVSTSCVSNYGDATGLHLDLAASGGLNERLVAALARVQGGAA